MNPANTNQPTTPAASTTTPASGQANTSIFQLSLPTRAQILRTIELAAVTYIASFVIVWSQHPDPFTKAAVTAALSAGATALFRFIVSFIVRSGIAS